MVDDKNIGFKSRKIRRNETGIYNVFVEWKSGALFIVQINCRLPHAIQLNKLKHLYQEIKRKLKVYLILLSGSITQWDIKEKEVKPKKTTYVSPFINFKRQFRPNYLRKSVSTNANTSRNITRSKYFFQTKGKYCRKDKT
jgi:hypothetical protein